MNGTGAVRMGMCVSGTGAVGMGMGVSEHAPVALKVCAQELHAMLPK